ncbi:unnamed protein product [Danaus chrysippus]|uniref:Vacuolar ATPase assembly protein VMA22 n=1 Tax=Danaus chrysippus TaxID=151541 RepID=A0A8J2QS90_9NEOP|nr:unnamed protein product [Danaus chrysippus]
MSSDKNECSLEDVCDLLDKLALTQLHLMEDKMRCELGIESSINNGSIHLAKSRYIMGQSSVSKERLPTESSPEFTASITCNTVEEDYVKQVKVIETQGGINPIHWFGVLVPQNLHKAKGIFQNAINFVIECVNINIQLLENLDNYNILLKHKNNLLKDVKEELK